MAMPMPVLEVVNFTQNREVLPVPELSFGDRREFALGHTTSCFVLRSPSGKLWMVEIPNEMYDDVAIPHAEALYAAFNIRDNVVAARDQDSAPSVEG